MTNINFWLWKNKLLIDRLAIFVLVFNIILFSVLMLKKDKASTITFWKALITLIRSSIILPFAYIYISWIPNLIIVCFINQSPYIRASKLLLINSTIGIIFIVIQLSELVKKNTTKGVENSDNERKIIKNSDTDTLVEIKDWRNQKRHEYLSMKNIYNLVDEKKDEAILYYDLLKLREWNIKRFSILIRDKFKCRDCNIKSKENHVHHLYYIKNEFPWEIDDEGLVTLCKKCHTKRHEREIIKVKEKLSNILTDSRKNFYFCTYCGGTGYLPQYHYHEGGICFKCMDHNNNGIFTNAIRKLINHGRYDDSRSTNLLEQVINKIDINYFKTHIVGFDYEKNYDYDEFLPF